MSWMLCTLLGELLKMHCALKLKKRGFLGLNSKQIRVNDLPAIKPIYGKALNVFVVSYNTLKKTGVSLVFCI